MFPKLPVNPNRLICNSDENILQNEKKKEKKVDEDLFTLTNINKHFLNDIKYR